MSRRISFSLQLPLRVLAAGLDQPQRREFVKVFCNCVGPRGIRGAGMGVE